MRLKLKLKLKSFICIALFIMLLACSGKAAKEESPESLFELGLNYLKGNDSLDIDMDKEKGIALIRRSAEQGDAAAQSNLGNAYYTGEGVPQDYVQAAYWYRKAAEQGVALAQNNLGVCYDMVKVYHRIMCRQCLGGVKPPSRGVRRHRTI